MNRRIEYCSVAAGVVLLVSGFAKALDTAAFSRTLALYGSETLRSSSWPSWRSGCRCCWASGCGARGASRRSSWRG